MVALVWVVLSVVVVPAYRVEPGTRVVVPQARHQEVIAEVKEALVKAGAGVVAADAPAVTVSVQRTLDGIRVKVDGPDGAKAEWEEPLKKQPKVLPQALVTLAAKLATPTPPAPIEVPVAEAPTLTPKPGVVPVTVGLPVERSPTLAIAATIAAGGFALAALVSFIVGAVLNPVWRGQPNGTEEYRMLRDPSNSAFNAAFYLTLPALTAAGVAIAGWTAL
jgi:hypothetical protein